SAAQSVKTRRARGRWREVQRRACRVELIVLLVEGTWQAECSFRYLLAKTKCRDVLWHGVQPPSWGHVPVRGSSMHHLPIRLIEVIAGPLEAAGMTHERLCGLGVTTRPHDERLRRRPVLLADLVEVLPAAVLEDEHVDVVARVPHGPRDELARG